MTKCSRTISLLILVLHLFAAAQVCAAQPRKAIVGVNSWYTPPHMTQQDMIAQFADNNVKTIRRGVGLGSTDFVIEAYHRGIGTIAIVYPYIGSKAKPKKSWSDVPLSELKPQEFIDGFKPILDKLESAGVTLTAIELGNEINTSRFNGDIASPGSGRVLGLSDLNNPNDAEGRAAAIGFRAYVAILSALKDMRDHSKLNRNTPIVAAGIAAWGAPGPKAWNGQLGVSLNDTIEFLRQSGSDKFVDGYGVHVYPGLAPGRSVATRIASLGKDIFAACTTAKPCWLTEWGIPDGSSDNASEHCPVDETKRKIVIGEIKDAFQHFVSEGTLAAIVFYDWSDQPNNTGAIFRCGALTDAGKLALSPM